MEEKHFILFPPAVNVYNSLYSFFFPSVASRFCGYKKSKHGADEKRLHFGNGHCKLLKPSNASRSFEFIP